MRRLSIVSLCPCVSVVGAGCRGNDGSVQVAAQLIDQHFCEPITVHWAPTQHSLTTQYNCTINTVRYNKYQNIGMLLQERDDETAVSINILFIILLSKIKQFSCVMCVLSCQKLKYYAGRPPSHSGSQQTDTFQIMSKLFSTYPDIFTKFPEKKILVRCH